MSNSKEIKGLLSQVRQAAEGLKAKINALDDQIEALYAKRELILSAPLTKADYMAVIRADVQTKARRFRGDLVHHLGMGKINYPASKNTNVSGLPIRYLDGGQNVSAPMSESAYYFYFEDAIVSGVERALEGREWPVDASPAAERDTAKQAIDDQIEALNLEREGLADDLVSCGVTQ